MPYSVDVLPAAQFQLSAYFGLVKRQKHPETTTFLTFIYNILDANVTMVYDQCQILMIWFLLYGTHKI